REGRKGDDMRHSILIRFVLLLIAIGVAFLSSCQSGNASGNNETRAEQQSLFVNAPGSPISFSDDGPGNVVIGDMNNDTKPDLVVAFGKTRRIMVLPGKGDGTFAAAVSTTTVTDSPGEIALGDVNGDGKLDLAIATHDSYNVALLLGDGKGNLTLGSPITMRVGTHPHTHGLALRDMKGDEKLALITVKNTENDVSVALGDGRGGFPRAPRSPFPVGPSPYPLAIGDVNGDGQLDIVATATATGP